MTKREKQLQLTEQALKSARIAFNKRVIEDPSWSQWMLMLSISPSEMAAILTEDRIAGMDHRMTYRLSREQVRALSENQISEILCNKNVIEAGSGGSLVGKMSVSQIQSLPIKVVNLLIRLQNRDSYFRSDFETFAKVLTREQVQGIPASRIDSVFMKLSEEQQSWVTPSQINRLSKRQFGSMSYLPIRYLSQYQVESLSRDQLRICLRNSGGCKHTLTDEQLTWLSDRQLMYFTEEMLKRLSVSQLNYIKDRLS